MRHQRVEADAEQHARGVLDGWHHPQPVGHGQRAQQQWIARRPDRIGHQGLREPKVGQGVPGELQRRAIGDHGQHPQDDGHDDEDRDRSVPADRQPADEAEPRGSRPEQTQPASVPIQPGAS